MSSWKYLESKDIWGLRRVMELHIGKRRPFLFITSFAPSLGPLTCLKSSFFNIRSAKLPNLVFIRSMGSPDCKDIEGYRNCEIFGLAETMKMASRRDQSCGLESRLQALVHSLYSSIVH